MNNNRRFRLLLAPIVVVLGVCASTSAAASPPTEATGTITNTSATFNSVRVAGSNLVFDLSATASYTGTFTGTSTLRGRLIVHADGSANFHDIETFTGTVNGVPGTVTFNLTGSNDAAFAVQETRTIIGATGELTGLQGVLHEVGTVVIPDGPVTTYTGKVG